MSETGNVLIAMDGGRTTARRASASATNILPADLAQAKQLILHRARTQGVSFGGWLFGECKVFLGSLGIDWANPANKVVLFALLRAGELAFARADLVGAMDRALVDASEVADRWSSWHFVVLKDGDRR